MIRELIGRQIPQETLVKRGDARSKYTTRRINKKNRIKPAEYLRERIRGEYTRGVFRQNVFVFSLNIIYESYRLFEHASSMSIGISTHCVIKTGLVIF